MNDIKIEINQRLPWADLCRVAAMFGVILLHSSAPVFNDYRFIPLDFFLVGNLIDSLTRVSVPLFLMLSGALLLNRVNDGQLPRRILKIALPLIFWSLVYVLIYDFRSGKPVDIWGAFIQMAHGPVMYHLPFVYMIIGIYIFLPILHVITDAFAEDQKLARYFFTLWILVNSFNIYFPINLLIYINTLGLQSWFAFFLLGSYLTRIKIASKLSMRNCFFVYLGASLCTFGLSWALNASSPTPNEIAYEYLSPNVIIASVAAFLCIQKIKISTLLVKPLAYISGLIFPVYFMHVLVMGIFTSGLLGFKINSYSIHPVFGILGLTIATFVVSLTISACIRVYPKTAWIFG